MTEKTNITSLPYDVNFNIFKELTLADIISLHQTNKSYKIVTENFIKEVLDILLSNPRKYLDKNVQIYSIVEALLLFCPIIEFTKIASEKLIKHIDNWHVVVEDFAGKITLSMFNNSFKNM